MLDCPHQAPQPGERNGLFSWHPVFMSIAFCLCLPEAILLFSPENSPFCLCSRQVKVWLHWTAQTLVVVAAALGLAFIISSKNRSELPHLVSWHSLLGVLTLAATCGQALCGLSLRFPQLLRISSVARLRLYHVTCGLVVCLLATFTVVLGICSDWFQAQIKGIAWYFCLALPFYPALVIMNQTTGVHLPKKRVRV
ncbi:cytochrome b561 domain-containing protein 1 isoform X3 [Gopherus evgoodei]|uniref:cytochrome b561 domain-containing protein 1 isoform X3 n=1 Tax=Gopherus evgoodei TaxID=1825980 RepID=UPI0011CF3F8E|nr:cytochrome b561 domain-containing protein 1 isoform X3 [Gopherus evgoodei]XP_030416952.1 cytochrome b561 domain-containing protein 1 isoform X3 [Gopherus evgoodei]